jgi:hypothetical protein
MDICSEIEWYKGERLWRKKEKKQRKENRRKDESRINTE